MVGLYLFSEAPQRDSATIFRCQTTAHGIPVWKRALDIALIILALPVVLPLTLVIAAVIKIGSRGPLLFKQERIGYRGQAFTIFKFRTMMLDTDPGVHRGHLAQLIASDRPMVKMDDHGDNRLVPLGRWIRATGLDELAQLLNVLRGEMSLVGPRPCLRYEYEHYQPWQHKRFDALPGLTGLWQVSGKNRTTFTEMMHLDIRYARCASLWLDLAIIGRTVPALIVQVQDMRRARNGNGNGNGHVNQQPESPLAVHEFLSSSTKRLPRFRAGTNKSVHEVEAA